MDVTAWIPLGIGGVVALLVLNWKREDDKGRIAELQVQVAEEKIRTEQERADKMLLLEALNGSTAATLGVKTILETLVSSLDIEKRLDKRLRKVEATKSGD